ncbi:TonB-dependent receptor domain-containing protein [Elizabethkingia miricola]|uniref:TonB-dependent receptor domain-containing protein n=1 Tax=Elizabethkingia miricola TaxID=172045 RepID=UPI003891EDF1
MKMIKMFWWYCLILGLVVIPSKLFSQTTPETVVKIKGIVTNSADNKVLSGSVIVLKSETGKVLHTITSSADGSFSASIPKHLKINIKISFLGYNDYNSEAINLENEDVDLGRISLEEKSNNIKGVVIAGNRKKPLIQNGKDKIVYNADSDISNKSGNATDVLRKAPMLTVGANGELKLRGNSNIKVLINGIPSGIMAKNLKEALKMIPASSIVSVEVITNPSAKYEAEGAGGVINIITKKKLKGTSGSLDLSGGNLEQSGNLALNIATGKFTISAMGNYSEEREESTAETERISLSGQQQTSHLFQRKNSLQTDKGGSAGLTIKYQPDSLQTIETSFSYWKGSWPQKGNLYNRYNNNSVTDEYLQKIKQSGRFDYKEWVVNYQKKFRREGQELQLVAQTSYSAEFSDYLTEQYKMDGKLAFRETGPNRGSEKEWSIQADYAQPLNTSGKILLETGVRYYKNRSQSSYEVINSHIPVDPSRLGNIKYIQDVFSAYMTLNFETDNDWTFRPGIRLEKTFVNANFQSGSPFKRNFTNWIPNLLIVKKLNENHELKFNYTERIRRPWIMDLNPYSNASDPLNITSGNPYLEPEQTRNIELSHVFTTAKKASLTSSVYYNFNKNSIEPVTVVNKEGVSYTTPSNIGENNRLGANISMVFSPVKKWTVNANAEVFYLQFRSKSLGLNNTGTFFTTSLSNTIALPDNLNLSISGDYGNGFITLQGKNSANYSYRFAISKQLMDNKASLTLAIINPFQKAFRENVYAFAPTFQSTNINRYYNRAATLTFSWQFGGLKPAQDKESRFSDESNDKHMRGKKLK